MAYLLNPSNAWIPWFMYTECDSRRVTLYALSWRPDPTSDSCWLLAFMLLDGAALTSSLFSGIVAGTPGPLPLKNGTLF